LTQPQRSSLPSGIDLITHATPGVGVVALYIWFDLGSADEPAGLEGAAHFLEHMLFKGTPTRPVGQAASEIEGMGGDLNAFTSHDETVFHATVQATAWREALDVLLDMTTQSELDPKEFEAERLVILEEIRRYASSPSSVLADGHSAAWYDGHPYAKPVLGTIESVSAMQRDDVVAFWRENYHAGRMRILAAGEVNHAEIASALATYDLANTGAIRKPLAELPPVHAPWVQVPSKFRSRMLQVGWNTPDWGHPDLAALEVLSWLLAHNGSGQLVERLERQDGLATGVWASFMPRRKSSSFEIGMSLLGEEKDAAAALHEVIGLSNQYGGRAVLRAREAIIADAIFETETVDDAAFQLGYYATTARAMSRDEWLRQLSAVRPSDVARAASTWLRPDQASHAVLGSAAPPASFEPPVREQASSNTHTFKSGAKLIHMPDPRPLVGIRIAALGGGLAVPDDLAGLPTVWGRALPDGIEGCDGEDFADRTDELAMLVDAVAGRSSLGITASLPAVNLRDAGALIGELVMGPSFSTDHLQRLRAELAEERDTQADRPFELATRAGRAAMWQGHPWRHPALGTEDSVARIGPAELRAWHHGHFAGEGLVVAVTGGDIQAAIDAFEWMDHLPPERVPLPQRPSPSAPPDRHLALEGGGEQASLVAWAPGVRIGDPDRHAIDLLVGLLSGQGGRLFMDLREAKSLAYSVWAHAAEGWDAGVVELGMSTSVERVDEAWEGLLGTYQRLVDAPPTEDELGRVRRMLVGQAAIHLQRVSHKAAATALATIYSVPSGLDAYRASLGAVTLQQVMDVAKRVLDAPWLRTTVLPA